MNRLLKAKAAVKEGVEFDEQGRIDDALSKYACAVGHFQSVLVSNDNEVADIRTQVEDEVKFYIERISKLDSNKNIKRSHLVKKIACSSDDDEDTKMQARIKSTMILEKPTVKFKDVCGLDFLKEDLLQAALLPLKQPQLFSTYVRPFKGFLLFGPPGTRKTFIAKALAGEIPDTRFFSISVGNVLSKYVGESESYIRNLFEVAPSSKPSIIFFDEVDVLAMNRCDSQHDTSRGVLTELLVQMDGMKGSNDGILIMASTNCPHHMDNGILRRFDKLVYVPLPTFEDRIKMFKQQFSALEYPEFSYDNFNYLATKTPSFSGSDISKVCNTANNKALARITKSKYFNVTQRENGKFAYVPCTFVEGNSNGNNVVNVDVMKLPTGSLCTKPHILFEELVETILQTKPTIPASDIRIYEEFFEERVGTRLRTIHTNEYQPSTCCDCFCFVNDFFCGGSNSSY